MSSEPGLGHRDGGERVSRTPICVSLPMPSRFWLCFSLPFFLVFPHPCSLQALGAPRPPGNLNIQCIHGFSTEVDGFSAKGAGWQLPGAAAPGIKSWNSDEEKPGEVGGDLTHRLSPAAPQIHSGRGRNRKGRTQPRQRDKPSGVWIPREQFQRGFGFLSEERRTPRKDSCPGVRETGGPGRCHVLTFGDI